MEGKEVRFGIANSALFATVTTDASCGAVNGMHDSFTPLGGMVPLLNIMLGEVIFGGVGSGLYGMIVFVILAVFIAGLMVGRTPEYLGKKIEAYDVKMAMLSVLVSSLTILIFAAIAVVSKSGLAGITQSRARTACRKFSTRTLRRSATTALRSLALTPTRSGTTPAPASPMLLGRFFVVIPILAIAGNLAAKKHVSRIAWHFPGHRAAVHRSAGLHHPDRRRAHLLPGAEPGPDPGTPADGRRKGFLRNLMEQTAQVKAKPLPTRRFSCGPLSIHFANCIPAR